MKVCIECGRNLPERKFRAYETKSGTHYTSRCRLCESRHTSARRKQDRLHGRLARLQCQYPRNDVYPSFYYYDNRSGESLEVSSCLSKLISAKAQITKAERRMNEYIEHNRQNNIFFDEDTDAELVKFREKLERKKLECAECEKMLELLVEKRRNNQ